MTYIEETKDEQKNFEYILHINLQSALLLRSILINQKFEYETLYEKDPLLEDFQNLKQIQSLVQLDRKEIQFRIQKVKQFIKLFDNVLTTKRAI